MSALVWFRRDLRLCDNPAWVAATREHDRVTALFVVDPSLWEHAPLRRTMALAANLAALDQRLAEFGGRLRVVRGTPASAVSAEATGRDAIYWNDDYTPYAQVRDRAVTRHLEGSVSRHAGVAFHQPGSVTTSAGTSYQVFTPYWRKWRELSWDLPGDPGDAAITADPGLGVPEHGSEIDAGERAAYRRLLTFLERVDRYNRERHRPDHDGTSRLSTDLSYGTIAPRRIRAEVGEDTPGREAFIRQLCWRDFYLQALWAWPDTVSEPFRG